MPVITEIEDLKRIYKRRVPKMFYDYAETGSWTEQTFHDNVNDFQDIRLRQRIAVDMDNRSTATEMIGEEVAMPVALAPVGLTGMQNADGEIKAARAAEKFGVPFCLSTMSICSIEDVAQHTTRPFWFQVYTLKDDDFMQRLMERAHKANCSAIVITVDLQILGQRHKDLKNGLSAPPKLTMKSVANMMTKVPWGLEMLQTKRRFFGNIVGHAQGVSDPSSLSSWTAEAFDPSLNWDRIKQLMDMWGGKVVLKGVMEVDDAVKAAELGADAIIGAFCGASRHMGMTAAEQEASYVTFGPIVPDPALGSGEAAPIELFEWWQQMIEVPVVAEGGLTPELIGDLAPCTDFFGIGDEIWGDDDPLGALNRLRAAMS